MNVWITTGLVLVLGVSTIGQVRRGANPKLVVTPSSYSVEIHEGETAPSGQFNVSNASNGALKWTVTQLPVTWAMISPLSGTNNGTVTIAFATASLSAGDYQTHAQFQSNGGQISAPINVRIVTGAPQEQCGDGIDNDGDGQIDEDCSPPPSDTRGPQNVPCPVGAIAVQPGQSLQAAVNAQSTGAVFCVKAGTHVVSGSVLPKSGQTFVGELGAILDGTGWTATDEGSAAFRCFGNENVDNVTIRNLVIRNLPKKGVYAVESCEAWTVENSEIYNTQYGVVLGIAPRILNNKLHHNNKEFNNSGNYAFQQWVRAAGESRAGLVQNNEIAFGGNQQKGQNTLKLDWINNWVHHNEGYGIWNDGEGANSLLDGNVSEDNAWSGIHWELSMAVEMRNNTLRRNGEHGIFVSTSSGANIHHNTLEDNWRGIAFFVNCQSVHQPWWWNPDLTDNLAHDNVIRVGTRAGSINNMFSWGACPFGAPGEEVTVDPYLSNSKNNRFEGNHYEVPDISNPMLLWGSFKSWAEWQAMGFDTTGTLVQR